MVAQEPWCYHPEQIASLTDWQLEFLYHQPAVERQKQLAKNLPESEGSGESCNPADPPPSDSPEFREWVIAQFQAMGMSRKTAETQYEQQAKGQ
jgi:hypothetical protein